MTNVPIPQKYRGLLYDFAPAHMDMAAECDILYQNLTLDGWSICNYKLYAREDCVMGIHTINPFCVLYFSTEGYIDLELNDGGQHRLFPGQFRLIRFNEGTHYMKFIAGRWYESFIIDLPLDWITQMASRSVVLHWLLDKTRENKNGISPAASRIMDSQLYAMIRAVRMHWRPLEMLAQVHLKALVLDQSLYALSLLNSAIPLMVADEPLLVNIIKSFIANNIPHLSTVEEIAANFGYGVRTFQQLFKNSTGVTVRDFLMRCKMEKAQRLLLIPGNTVKAVAVQVGYLHPGNFTREYKNYFKHAPSALVSSGDQFAENDS